MNVSDERKYVIVCNRHTGLIKDALLFWGKITDDKEERSFGGYTVQFDLCERYTRKELEIWRGENYKAAYPFFDEIPLKRKSSNGLLEFKKCPDVFISIDELNALGYSVIEVMTRK